MSCRIFAIVCILTFSIPQAFAQDSKFEFEGRYLVSDLDAQVKVVESGIGGKFDFKDDLGFKDENLPEARLIFHSGPNSLLRLCYTQVNYSGDQAVAQSIEFKGRTYTAGTRVESDLNIQYTRLGWFWYFLNLADDKVKLGSVLEAKAVLADVSLKAVSLSISDSKHLIAGLPTAGLALDVSPIEKIEFFGEISGIAAGDYGYFFDAEAGVGLIPSQNLSIKAGYRIIDIKAENDPDFLRMQISGPFVSLNFSF